MVKSTRKRTADHLSAGPAVCGLVNPHSTKLDVKIWLEESLSQKHLGSVTGFASGKALFKCCNVQVCQNAAAQHAERACVFAPLAHLYSRMLMSQISTNTCVALGSTFRHLWFTFRASVVWVVNKRSGYQAVTCTARKSLLAVSPTTLPAVAGRQRAPNMLNICGTLRLCLTQPRHSSERQAGQVLLCFIATLLHCRVFAAVWTSPHVACNAPVKAAERHV